ncbi:globin domain-containing protein [Allonocardiopsis opalescens]|uniref:nitric oxide dioxygenase n=1 Tax=Allonocardiopsis opalescens TaxID=1144618 RepID=A0A2T0QAP3_9ACTN|nr:globin domain-containing protein [Allonocardiopsis opalescens]PRY00880.1 NAD(P)H-flavin reductase [Allonocardiopsis opalescens]
MDVARLKDSWRAVAAHGDQVPLFFYSSLFLSHPETRELFPTGMAGQRDRLVSALGRIVSQVDQVDELLPFLQGLGKDHRRFAVVAEHYPAVGAALLDTLAHFLGPAWTDELASDWTAAYGLVAKVMTEAADEAAKVCPPWWDAEIISHERRGMDVAVFTVRPNYQLDFRPGQSVAAESNLRPKLWRYLTPANAPRADGTIDFHVRQVDGGIVSPVLVHGVRPGDFLRLGSPVGERLTLSGEADAVLIAGGTGIAPFRAIIEQVAAEHTAGGTRKVHLFAGAALSFYLYDLDGLRKLGEEHPWLTVVPCVSQGPAPADARTGDAVDVALRHSTWADQDFYVCGSPQMVAGTVRRLREEGVPDDRVRTEEFGSDTPIGGTS